MNLTEVCEYESSDEEDMEVDHATIIKTTHQTVKSTITVAIKLSEPVHSVQQQ